MPDGSNPERVERLIRTIEELHVVLDEDRERLAEMVAAVEKLQTDRKKDRRWAAFAAVVLLALAGLAFWDYQTAKDREAEREQRAIERELERQVEDARLCQRAVQVREDGRAMWQWLIEAVAETSPLAGEARTQLDTLLPRLKCNADNQPVPIED